MSIVTRGESSLAVDCTECNFSVLVVHETITTSSSRSLLVKI